MQVHTTKALNSLLLKDGAPDTHTHTQIPQNDRTKWSLLRPILDLSASCGLQAGRSGERRAEPGHRRATLAVPAGTGVARALGRGEEDKDDVDQDRPDRLPETSAPARRTLQQDEMSRSGDAPPLTSFCLPFYAPPPARPLPHSARGESRSRGLSLFSAELL